MQGCKGALSPRKYENAGVDLHSSSCFHSSTVADRIKSAVDRVQRRAFRAVRLRQGQSYLEILKRRPTILF